MKLKRIMLAAPKSGSGKTTITCAMLELLKEKGEQVVSYKCGPDYIDPMFHEEVLHIPSKNLDTFFTDEEQTRALFIKDRSEQEFAVIEGVMGLFDGLSGIYEEGSSYHLAKITKTPIILVVDAKGMGRSLLPGCGCKGNGKVPASPDRRLSFLRYGKTDQGCIFESHIEGFLSDNRTAY